MTTTLMKIVPVDASVREPKRPWWIVLRGKRLVISPSRLGRFLQKKGFHQVVQGRTRTASVRLIHRFGQVAREVDAAYIRKYLLTKVRKMRCASDLVDLVCDLPSSTIERIMRTLPVHSIDGMVPNSRPFTTFADDAACARFIFSNGVIAVTADSIRMCPLDAAHLGQAAIWESDIHRRAITLESPGAPAKGLFEKFCECAFMRRGSIGDVRWTNDFQMTADGAEHYRRFQIALGYLLHRYRDPANPRAVIFVDEDSDDMYAQGGTGKSLILQALGHLRQVSRHDGKRFQNSGTFGGRFQWSTVTPGISIIVIDDVGPKFQIAGLFAMLSGDMETEGKGKDKTVIPAERVAKFAISSNFILPLPGTSFTRRIYIVEFGPYWAEAHRRGDHPSDPVHLGKVMFGPQFTDEDWNQTFNFFFRCVQRYLSERLGEASLPGYGLRALRRELGPELVALASEYFDGLADRHVDPQQGEFLADLYDAFSAAYPEHGCRRADFATKLQRAGEHFGWEFNPHKAHKGATPTDRRWRTTAAKRETVRWGRRTPLSPGAGVHGSRRLPGSAETPGTTDSLAGVTGVNSAIGSGGAMSCEESVGSAWPSPQALADNDTHRTAVEPRAAIPAVTDDTGDTTTGAIVPIGVSASADISEPRDYDPWTEKYRPRTVADCILPIRLSAPFLAMVNRRSLPNLLLSGLPGVGKTSVARALCAQIGADPLVINASNDRGIEALRERIVPFASTTSLFAGLKAVIFDEADGLTADAQNLLRGLLEEVAGRCVFLFTANDINKIVPALRSRCVPKVFDFRDDERADLIQMFAERAEMILNAEAIRFDPALLARVISRNYPDFRSTLNAFQGAVVNGALLAAALD